MAFGTNASTPRRLDGVASEFAPAVEKTSTFDSAISVVHGRLGVAGAELRDLEELVDRLESRLDTVMNQHVSKFEPREHEPGAPETPSTARIVAQVVDIADSVNEHQRRLSIQVQRIAYLIDRLVV